MLFNSFEFLCLFLPLTYLGYLLISLKNWHSLKIAWLVTSSLFFYAWWHWTLLGLLMGSILWNYCFGLILSEPSIQVSVRKKALILGVTINLGVLAYFKYFNFLIDNLEALTQQSWHFPHIFLPLAISFFTFQQITYLVDTYQGKAKPCAFLEYCLFVTFFPQLIAGPIVHHQEMLPQFLKKQLPAKFQNLCVGLSIFMLGLFKKSVIADNLALIANPAFQAASIGSDLTALDAWVGLFAYSFQLYFDFSGYSDMAIGLGRLFGIKLPQNFNSPYKATNIIDFWRRWHMTLSRFLRDYIYIPLGGNRQGILHQHKNILITLVLGGLWHGAGWNFIVWGLLHAGFLIINHLWQQVRQQSLNQSYQFWGHALTVLCVVLAWVLFRADNLQTAIFYYQALFDFSNLLEWQTQSRLVGLHSVLLLVLLLIVLFTPNSQQIFKRYAPVFGTKLSPTQFYWRPTLLWGIGLGCITLISVISLSGAHEFIYYQF